MILSLQTVTATLQNLKKIALMLTFSKEIKDLYYIFRVGPQFTKSLPPG